MLQKQELFSWSDRRFAVNIIADLLNFNHQIDDDIFMKWVCV